MTAPTFRVFSSDRVTTWILRAIQLGALLALFARDGVAQDSSLVVPPGLALGFTAGLPSYDRQTSLELTTIGVSLTQIRPARLGFDVSVGTMPRLFVEGMTAIGARVGAVLPLRVAPGVMALPGVGVSLIGVTDFSNGAAGTYGWNANLGLLGMVTQSAALRTTLSVHQFDDVRNVYLVEMGLSWFVK
jgi:hypothetical protein